jgi:hypothetical protein
MMTKPKKPRTPRKKKPSKTETPPSIEKLQEFFGVDTSSRTKKATNDAVKAASEKVNAKFAKTFEALAVDNTPAPATVSPARGRLTPKAAEALALARKARRESRK